MCSKDASKLRATECFMNALSDHWSECNWPEESKRRRIKRLKSCETFQNACYCYEPLFQKLMRREHQDDSRQVLSQIVTAPVSWAQVGPTYRRDKESSKKLKTNQQTSACFCIRNYGPSSSCFFLDSCTYIIVNLRWNIEYRISMQIGYL